MNAFLNQFPNIHSNQDSNRNQTGVIIFNNQTFQSVLSKLFNRVGVSFPLISSRGRPSNPPAVIDEFESDSLTVLFATAEAP